MRAGFILLRVGGRRVASRRIVVAKPFRAHPFTVTDLDRMITDRNVPSAAAHGRRLCGGKTLLSNVPILVQGLGQIVALAFAKQSKQMATPAAQKNRMSQFTAATYTAFRSRPGWRKPSIKKQRQNSGEWAPHDTMHCEVHRTGGKTSGRSDQFHRYPRVSWASRSCSNRTNRSISSKAASETAQYSIFPILQNIKW